MLMETMTLREPNVADYWFVSSTSKVSLLKFLLYSIAIANAEEQNSIPLSLSPFFSPSNIGHSDTPIYENPNPVDETQPKVTTVPSISPVPISLVSNEPSFVPYSSASMVPSSDYDESEQPVTSPTPMGSVPEECDFVGDSFVIPNSDGLVSVRHAVSNVYRTIRIQVLYKGIGYVSFAFSNSSNMFPNIAVIGLPDNGTVLKYSMTGNSLADVSPLDDEQQESLINSKILQTSGEETVLEYTRLLDEQNDSETVVDVYKPNRFIWAVGYTNDIGNHVLSGSAILESTQICDNVTKTKNPQTSPPTKPPVVIPTIASTFVPSAVPKKVPTVTPIVVPLAIPTTPISSPLSTNCSYRGNGLVVPGSNNLVTVRNMVNWDTKTISIQVTYLSQGYIGFGFSTGGKMYPSVAVIGLPASNTTKKYNMTGYGLSQVAQVDNVFQQATMTMASIRQNVNETILDVTRPLNDTFPGEVLVVPEANKNQFIWAVGVSNALGNHILRGSANLTSLEFCGNVITPVATPAVLPIVVPTSAPVSIVPNTTTNGTLSPSISPVTNIPIVPTAASNGTLSPYISPSTGIPVSVAPGLFNPVILPAASMTPSLLIRPTTILPDNSTLYNCSFHGETYVVSNSDSKVSIRTIFHPVMMAVTTEMTYAGIGYVAFGYSRSGLMVPSVVFIGLPENKNVAKYFIRGKSIGSITLVNTTSIPNAAVAQNETHTVMTFTRLIESEETISDGGIDLNTIEYNTFIWAVGANNTLSQHKMSGKDSILLDQCAAIEANGTNLNNQTTTPGDPLPKEDYGSKEESPYGKKIYDDLYIKMKPTDDKKYVSVELTHIHNGLNNYIALGISSTGTMKGSIAIIGASDNPMPMKYDLLDNTLAGVVKSPEDRQTLVDPSYLSNATQTVLKFKKLVDEPNEIPVLLSGETTFLFAIGSQASLGSHGTSRGTFICNPSSTCGLGVFVPELKSKRTAWLAHGAILMLAWVILIPSSVGVSLLRQLFPPGRLWCKLHKTFAYVGILLTVVGFSIAVVTVQQEGKNHFRTNRHTKVGLVVFLVAILQVLHIFCEPAEATLHIPPNNLPGKATHVEDVSSDEEESKEEEGNIDYRENDRRHVSELPGNTPVSEANGNQDSNSNSTEKRAKARARWEMYHRVTGLAVIGISWYACHTGVKLFEILYYVNYTNAMWGVIGGLVLTFFMLYIYSKVR
jgi:DOMON domain